MTPTETRHGDLERRLRAAVDAVPARPVPADAWVELQSRLATRDARHSRRFLAAAAVVALVFALVGVVALVHDGRNAAGPAGGSSGDDYWASENILGEPVVAETLTLGGQETRHELVLSDTTGKGPSLCDRYRSAADGSGAGGCTARDPDADRSEVAIDWLSGTTGSGDLHGIVAAVDSRVMKVQIWMSNGDETLADLHPTGWDDTKMFALTVQDGNGPTPQRLVAYSDATGTVLQAVDLSTVFGHDWLPGDTGCGERPASVTWSYLGDPDGSKESVTARLGFASASLRIVTNAGTLDSSHCVNLRPTPLAAVSVAGSTVLIVTGPEVATVRLRSTGAPVQDDVRVPERSSWRLAVLRMRSPADFGTAELEAVDRTGHVVQVGRASDLRSPGRQHVTQD
jgi:hypothetical protein